MGAVSRVPIGPLTPRDIDAVMSGLPARDRAALEWASSGVKQAINLLHEGPLTEANILKAATLYAAAIRPFAEMGARIVTEEPMVFGSAVQERLQELGSRVHGYLGTTEHAARLARTLSAMFIVGALAMRELAAHPEHSGQILQQATEVDITSSEASGMRVSVLVIAVLEAIERGIAVERVRALIERADLEGWVIARGLASVAVPGGPIAVPGYPIGATATPSFKTELARQLWEQRRRVVAESGTLTDAEVEAEVAARRGGASGEC